MMKKYLFVLISLIILLAPTIAFAESSDSAKGQLIRNQVRDQKAEAVASKTAFLSQIRKERIRSYFGRMVSRIEAVIGRLNILISRMEARIASIEAEDSSIDLTSPKKDIADAKTQIAKATSDLEIAKNGLEDVLSSQNPKEAFKTIISTISDIKHSLIDAHTLLVHAIGDIKGLRVGENK